MDSSPRGPAWSQLLRMFAEVELLEDALSTLQPLQREAGTTTDDPHHPARTLLSNVYTIYGVIASINRYILSFLMQKARECLILGNFFLKKSSNSSAWQEEASGSVGFSFCFPRAFAFEKFK